MKPVPLEQILNKEELKLVELIYASPGYVVIEREKAQAAKPSNLGIIKPVRPGSHNYVCTDNVYQEKPCKS